MFEIKMEGLDDVLRALERKPQQATTAMVSAMNRAIGSARSVLSRAIARDTGLKVREVNAALKTRNASASAPEARIDSETKPISLTRFGARGRYPSRGRGPGISVRSGIQARLAGGQSADLGRSFIARFHGRPSIFQRLGRKRGPLSKVYGPSVAEVSLKHRAAGVARLKTVFEQRFEHEMKRLGGEVAGRDE